MRKTLLTRYTIMTKYLEPNCMEGCIDFFPPYFSAIYISVSSAAWDEPWATTKNLSLPYI
jgi:hypothetical protein